MRWLSVALLLLCVGCTYRIPFGAPDLSATDAHGWGFKRVWIPGHVMRQDPESI